MPATAQSSKKQQAKKQKTASKAFVATTLKSASPEISQTQGNPNLPKKYSALGGVITWKRKDGKLKSKRKKLGARISPLAIQPIAPKPNYRSRLLLPLRKGASP